MFEWPTSLLPTKVFAILEEVWLYILLLLFSVIHLSWSFQLFELGPYIIRYYHIHALFQFKIRSSWKQMLKQIKLYSEKICFLFTKTYFHLKTQFSVSAMQYVNTLFLIGIKCQFQELTMSHIVCGPRGIWTFFLFVLSQRLLMAQIDQYYEVSRDAFFDIVTYTCELRRVTHSDTIMECAQFCSMPRRPRCFAMALDNGFCWVCGEDVPGQQVTAGNIKASTYWVHAGW